MEKERLKELLKKTLALHFAEIENFGTKEEQEIICKLWANKTFGITTNEYDEIMGV